MHLCLFEDRCVRRLEPLVLTRHVADLRFGAHTIAEMHRRVFGADPVTYHARRLVEGVTRQEHPGSSVNSMRDGGVLLLNGRYVPENGPLADHLLEIAASGGPATAFRQADDLVAAWLPESPPDLFAGDTIDTERLGNAAEQAVDGARMISRLWDLVDDLEGRLVADFEANGRSGTEGAEIHDGAHLVGSDLLIESGARVLPGAVVNALEGPVWLAAEAVVEENAVVRGPTYIGPKTAVKAGARVDASAAGHWCKIGGEVHGSILHSLAAKPHDGYLGNSYLGRWCNLGADTNTSNLKNDYGEVTMFDPVEGDFAATGRQFLGLIMGDHSKSSINSMFNTGTVVGVSCNLYGSGFPPRLIPSFAWGGADGLVEYRLEKALRVAEAVMARRNSELSAADCEMLTAVFDYSSELRRETLNA